MLQQYQTIQDQFKTDSEERMVRQIKIAKEDVSEDEIQQMLQQKELNVFKSVLTNSQKSTIEAVHAEVLETYNDVVELAEQFRELHELFVDFAALVAEQDELIDIISSMLPALTFVAKSLHTNNFVVFFLLSFKILLFFSTKPRFTPLFFVYNSQCWTLRRLRGNGCWKHKDCKNISGQSKICLMYYSSGHCYSRHYCTFFFFGFFAESIDNYLTFLFVDYY